MDGGETLRVALSKAVQAAASKTLTILDPEGSSNHGRAEGGEEGDADGGKRGRGKKSGWMGGGKKSKKYAPTSEGDGGGSESYQNPPGAGEPEPPPPTTTEKSLSLGMKSKLKRWMGAASKKNTGRSVAVAAEADKSGGGGDAQSTDASGAATGKAAAGSTSASTSSSSSSGNNNKQLSSIHSQATAAGLMRAAMAGARWRKQTYAKFAPYLAPFVSTYLQEEVMAGLLRNGVGVGVGVRTAQTQRRGLSSIHPGPPHDVVCY